jgi:hypothetical protein
MNDDLRNGIKRTYLLKLLAGLMSQGTKRILHYLAAFFLDRLSPVSYIQLILNQVLINLYIPLNTKRVLINFECLDLNPLFSYRFYRNHLFHFFYDCLFV